MNDDDAIFEAQLSALMRLVAAVFAVAGLVPGGPVLESLSVSVRRKILRMLSPAEAALRRLIFIRARGLVLKARKKRGKPSKPIPKGNGSSDRIPPFALIDPRKWFAELAKKRRKYAKGRGPSISSFDDPRPAVDVPEERKSEAEINPAGLCRRLQALHKALQDIPAQAKRLARLQARRRAAGEPMRRTQPMRPGWPPGYRQNWSHPVDKILWECHVFACREPRPPDRS